MEKTKIKGLEYVSKTMNWYCALADVELINEENAVGLFGNLKKQFEEEILEFYKALLLFQMKGIYSSFKHSKLTNFVRGALNWEDWMGQLQEVKDREILIQSVIEQYGNVYTKKVLSRLRCVTGTMAHSLEGILADVNKIDTYYEKDRNEECLRALYVQNPTSEMEILEMMKGKLFRKSFEWIFKTREYSAFTHWSDNKVIAPCRILWINGPTGTGKTMLMIGIIRELFETVKSSPSCFFFHDNDKSQNTAVAALRTLIWMLILQQPALVTYLRQDYKTSGSAMFSNPNSFFALKKIFMDMIRDKNLPPCVYLILDALDECDRTKPGRGELIDLVATSVSVTKKIKWLISSRPETDIVRRLKKFDTKETIELTSEWLRP